MVDAREIQSEFEEKQYGSPLDLELVARHGLSVPGMVLERQQAIDAAVFTVHPYLQRLWPGTKTRRESECTTLV